MRRLPLLFAIATILIKLVVVALIRASSDVASGLVALALADPVPTWAAQLTTELAFDQRRIVPSAGEALTFDVALVLFSGGQAYMCGVLIKWIWSRRRRGRKPTTTDVSAGPGTRISG